MTSRAVVLANLASSNILEVDSTTDRVGIGSTQPTTRLDVSGNIKAVHGNFTGVVTATSGTFNGPVTIGGTLTYEDVTNIDVVGVITARSDVSIADKIIHTGDTNTSIRFPAADTFTVETAGTERVRITSAGQVIIGDTDADNSNGNFDDLIIGNNASTTETHGITIVCGNASSNGGIAFSDGSGADAYRGMISYEHADNSMRFRTNATERFRITSAGKVGIGTVDPDTPLEVSGGTALDTATFNSHHANGTLINLQRSGTSKGFLGSGKNIADATGGVDDIGLRANANLIFATGGGTERVRIDSSGRLLLGTTVAPSSTNTLLRVHCPISSSNADAIQIGQNTNGADKTAAALAIAVQNGGESTNAADLIFKTASGGSTAERVRITSGGDLSIIDGNLVVASGHGIDFSATSGSGTSELLDDYEEGSWTPTYFSSGATFTYHASTQGNYVKIGNTVWARGTLRTNTVNGGTNANDVKISGLPYTVQSTGLESDYGPVYVYSASANSFAGDYPLSGQSIPNTDDASLTFRAASNGPIANLQYIDLNQGSNTGANFIKFMIQYTV